MTEPVRQPQRNPGPSWGYGFLSICDRLLPRIVFRVLLWLGTGVGLVLMTRQRRHSRNYLQWMLGRKPTWFECWRHFFTFMLSLMELFRLGRGDKHEFVYAEGTGTEFEALARSNEPAFFGTFHVGNSDLLGYALSHYDRQVRMVRLRVSNSNETRWLGSRFANHLQFIWVDRPESILFHLKDAVQSGCSIAMKCDRTEMSTKRAYFRFLGAEREFPITIYHLACLFSIPVTFSIGYADGDGRTVVLTSRVFRPHPVSREENLLAARAHFQETLDKLECLLRKNPFLWFNFLPLNRTQNEKQTLPNNDKIKVSQI